MPSSCLRSAMRWSSSVRIFWSAPICRVVVSRPAEEVGGDVGVIAGVVARGVGSVVRGAGSVARGAGSVARGVAGSAADGAADRAVGDLAGGVAAERALFV